MADQHNDNIPALTNQIGEDIPDIKENLEFHKDIFQAIGTGFSNTDATAFAPNKWTLSTFTASLVLSTGVQVALVDSTAKHIGVRLSAATAHIMYAIKHNGTNGVTISTATGTIDGNTNIVLSEDDEAVMLDFDGTNYHRLSTHKPTATLPHNYLTGLTLSVAATDVQDIEVAAGQCTDSANAYNITLSSALIKQLDAVWAAGTNAGGIADNEAGACSAGAMSANFWGHGFIIKNNATGSVDFGVDIVTNASNLLNTSELITDAGWSDVSYRRVGSIKGATGGSASSIEAFVQNGDDFLFTDPPLVLSIDLSTAATTVALIVPPDYQVEAHINCVFTAGGASVAYVFSPDANEETAVDSNAGPLANIGTHSGDLAAAQLKVRTDTSKQIKASSDTSGTGLRIAQIGWKDRRGRDG
jgi:hypothetical protein